MDKRNVELECPHCDRTFKQVMLVVRLLMPAYTYILQAAKLLILTFSACMQIQRFREHIQKKHADMAEAGGDASAASSSAFTMAPSAEKPQVSLSTASQRTQTDSYAWPSQNEPAVSLQGKTMDVGAKAGVYTEKSPKMLLHEWCIQKKRPTPRYRITVAEEGEQITKAKVQHVAAACPCFLCIDICCDFTSPDDNNERGHVQVVMADPKDRDEDIVVFLAVEHQCSSQEETGQRTAVTALHRIAGERALHRVLPEMYRPMWKQLGEKVNLQVVRHLFLFLEVCFAVPSSAQKLLRQSRKSSESVIFPCQAEAKAQGAARAAAAAEARQVREKARRLSEMRRAPKDVVMSEAQRRLVQSILRDQGHDLGSLTTPAAASQSEEGLSHSLLRLPEG